MKRLAFLNRLSQPSSIRQSSSAGERRANDGTPGTWFPLQRFRLWDNGRHAPAIANPHANADAHAGGKLVLSYRTLQAAEDVAALMRQNIPNNQFEVEDAGPDTLQCINHYTGEIRTVTAGQWQAQWPRTPLPEDYQSKDYQSGNNVPKGDRKTRKGAEHEPSHAALHTA